MNVRRAIVTCLIGLSLAGAPTITAAASTWCRAASQSTCECCHAGDRGQGCEMRCSEPPSVLAITSADHAPTLRPGTVHASWFTSEPVLSHRAVSAGTVLASDVTHAPPLKRYLLACTFRL